LSCPICEKRKPARFCPAKGEKICAVCCGTEREVSIECPSDCSYLVAGHHYEDEHQHSIPGDTPFLDVKLPEETIHTHQIVLSGLAFVAAKFSIAHTSVTDPDVIAAFQAIAETWKTLAGGIYYEKPPEAPLPRELYTALSTFLNETKQQPAEHGRPAIKDSEIFILLVFLYRIGLLRTNSRPRSRRYIEFLRAQFPQTQETQREESRIIVP
jgi:hypothetical protein